METNDEPMGRTQTAVAGQKLVSDLGTIREDAEALLKATADDVSDKVQEARDRLSTALERTKSAFQNSPALANAKAAANKADVTIRDHPYESIGAAFGIGLLIGVLVMRR